jgi:hypothetical protein
VNEQLDVQRVGDLIVARVRGEPTPALLKACHEQILCLSQASGTHRVLYDTREMLPPTVDVPWSQRDLDASMKDVRLRRAIVVPDSRLAFLARLAFGDGDYRVFYDDVAAATSWLSSERPA